MNSSHILPRSYLVNQPLDIVVVGPVRHVDRQISAQFHTQSVSPRFVAAHGRVHDNGNHTRRCDAPVIRRVRELSAAVVSRVIAVHLLKSERVNIDHGESSKGGKDLVVVPPRHKHHNAV